MDYSSKEDIVEYIFERAKYFIVPSKENNNKSKFLQSNFLLYCVVLVLTLRIITGLVSINIPQNVFFADITKSALENFVNQTRQSAGLQPLAVNEKLNQAANSKAQNMVQDQYFEHTSPTGVTPWFWFSQAGYKYKYAGENLAIGFYDSQEVFNAWLNSPSHKANIINPNYTEVGTAVLSGFGQNNSVVVVQEFASPAPVTIAKINTKTKTTSTSTETLNTGTNTSTVNNQKTTNTQVTTTEKNTKQTQTSTTNNQVANSSNEKVLSQTTESQNYIGSTDKNGVNNLPSKVMNTVLYNYDGLLQDIIYGLSLIVIGILFTLILFNFKISFNKQLVVRAVLIIVLLSTATLANKEMIIAFIPHQILI